MQSSSQCGKQKVVCRHRAQMAELVDALGSGPSGGNTVEVRVLFWAPKNGTVNDSTRKTVSAKNPLRRVFLWGIHSTPVSLPNRLVHRKPLRPD